MEWTFRVAGVTKVYANRARANDAISLHVEPGEVYGLLGPNVGLAWREAFPLAARPLLSYG